MSNLEIQKKNAALQAVTHIKNNMTLGLGSGTTAAYAIQAIGERIKTENLQLQAVPTSYQAFQLAVQNHIPITTLEEHPTIDLTIDGADQIDPNLNLIKGLGAALTREKIVATVTKHNIIVADHTKQVQILGENNHPVPIEVLQFAIPVVQQAIRKLGGNPTLRETKGKLGPTITDNGNAIIDATFGNIPNPQQLHTQLKNIPGILETGIFTDLTQTVYIATATTTQKLTKPT